MYMIYLQYIHNEKKLMFTTGVRVNKINWNTITQRGVKMRIADQMLIDVKMEALKDHVRELFKNKESVSIENVRDTYRAVLSKKDKEKVTKPVVNVIEAFKTFREAKQNERERGTLIHYDSVLNTLTHYQSQKAKTGLKFKDIDHSFEDRFKDFLRKQTKKNKGIEIMDSTIGQRVKVLKTFMAWADKRPEMQVLPAYKDYKVDKSKGIKVYLTETELEMFKNAPVNSKAMEISKDVFVLQCNTSLALSDVSRLESKHIVDGAIDMQRHKTGKEIYIPLNKDATTILEKYQYKVPKIIEQVYRRHIKQIAKDAGIGSQVELISMINGKQIKTTKYKYEVLSTHAAVRTFILIAADKGFTVAELAQATGKTAKVIISNYLGVDKKGMKERMKSKWS